MLILRHDLKLDIYYNNSLLFLYTIIISCIMMEIASSPCSPTPSPSMLYYNAIGKAGPRDEATVDSRIFLCIFGSEILNGIEVQTIGNWMQLIA